MGFFGSPGLAEVAEAVRKGWGKDTCDPDDLADWSPNTPSRGQCGVTALVVQDLLGGDLVLGQVHKRDTRVGVHWWNRLADGVEVDLTRAQFSADEVVTGGEIVERPPGPPRRCRAQYELLQRRVFASLGVQAAAR